MNPNNTLLRCPHCDFNTALWVKGKSSGYGTMSDHVAEAHKEEYRRVAAGLEEMDEDIRRAEEQAEQT